MIDVRELIIDRLQVVTGLLQIDSLPVFTRTLRNATEIPENVRPAAIIFDGNEEASETDANKSRKAPRRVTMRPQILLCLGDQPDVVGTRLNTIRAALIYALQEDTELLGLTLNSDGLVYEGCTAYAANGRMIEGTLVLTFAITYLLRHSDLTP